MISQISKRDHLSLLLIFLFAVCVFVGVGFDLGIDGDDIFYLSPDLRFYYESADRTYLWMVQARQFLLATYIWLYGMSGSSQPAMHFIFAALWLATGGLVYVFLRKRFSPAPSLVAALFFLGYAGKYEVVGWASAGLYLLVMCILLLIGIIITSERPPLWAKMTVACVLYWISLHIYEILLPLVPLPVLWLAWEISTRGRKGKWSDAFAVTLPIVATAVHIAILGSNVKPIWQRSGGSAFWEFFSAIPGTMAKTFDAFGGARHLDLVGTNFAAAKYVVSVAGDRWFAIGCMLLVVLVCFTFAVTISGRKAGSQENASSGYWLFFGAWLLVLAPAVNTPVVMGMPFTPSRLIYLPSLGAAVLLAVALERFGSRLLKAAVLGLVCFEFLVMHTILFQYASTAKYDGDLSEKLRALHLTLSPGDSLSLRLAPNDFIFKVWNTVPSKFESGGAQSIIILDYPGLQFHDNSYPFHLRLKYYGDRSDAPPHDATHVIQQMPDGSLCVRQTGQCAH